MDRAVVWLAFSLVLPSWTFAETQVEGSPRVRGSSPAISEAIDRAFERSPAFRDLVAAINGTNGIVYVHHGRCGRNVLACVLLAVTRAGSFRILHTRVDPRRRGYDLMVDIGHELRHAVEMLNEPGIVDGITAHNFYQRSAGGPERYHFETQEAIDTEQKIDSDLRRWGKERQGVMR